MKIKLLLATLLFIVAFSANAQTNNLVQTGKTQLKNNQYSSAFATFKRAAANGNTEAMYYVGLCWENGFGTQQDIYEAMDWYLKAADKGNGEACFRVSWAYQDGCVAQINPVKAAECAKKAANAGNIAGIEWYAQCLASRTLMNRNAFFRWQWIKTMRMHFVLWRSICFMDGMAFR